jgi:hypothetical protein
MMVKGNFKPRLNNWRGKKLAKVSFEVAENLRGGSVGDGRSDSKGPAQRNLGSLHGSSS